MNPAAGWRLVAGAVALLATSCGSASSGEGTATTSTTPGSTTLATTVGAPVSLPSAGDLDLDLPGASGEVDLETCTLRFAVEADTLHFPQGSAALPTDGPGRDALNAVLDQFASAEVVEVVGHASTEGSAEVNDPLAAGRAMAVADAGRARLPGVEFRPRSMGSTSTTVVEDGTEATRSKNRRVELTAPVRLEECTTS